MKKEKNGKEIRKENGKKKENFPQCLVFPREKKAPVEGAPKKANGLTKPMTISPQLAAIVGAAKDEKMARSVGGLMDLLMD